MMFLKTANLGARFLLELCMLGALGYWGVKSGNSLSLRLVLSVGAPLLAALVWGICLAPRATIVLPSYLHLLLEFVIFGISCIALYKVGHPILAGSFTLAIVINRILIVAWKQSAAIQRAGRSSS